MVLHDIIFKNIQTKQTLKYFLTSATRLEDALKKKKIRMETNMKC